MTVEIEKLFTRRRFSSGPSLLILILYAPIGILLLILRIFISLQLCLASFVLPTGTFTRKFVLRVLYSVLGIIIQEKDCQKKDQKCRLLVSNHLTPFDHLAISLVYPCISVGVYNLPGPLSSLLCYHNFGLPQGREVMRTNIQAYLNKPHSLPLLLHPEGAMTNGQIALMKYGLWAFDIEKSVLVLGLKVNRIPILHISPSVLGASWAADLFYLLFSPMTIYNLRYVGKMMRTESESVQEFSLRIQKATASALHLETTSYTLSDKMEYMKRLSREETRVVGPCVNTEVHSMALQVREVLPHLPLDIIKKDLVRTRNVDITITNFLEGNIPEASPPFSASPIAGSSTASAISPAASTVYSSLTPVPRSGDSADQDNLNMAAQTFGRSAHERMQSFQERKLQLIEKAKRRYIQKHNLSFPLDSC